MTNYIQIMNKEIQIINEQIDRLAGARGTNPHDKIIAYQHKILHLLLQEKTTKLMN